MKINKIITLFWAICLVQVTANAGQNVSFPVQIPNAQWWKAVQNGDQQLSKQLNLGVSVESIAQLAEVKKRIEASSNKRFTIGLAASNEVNAYAKKASGYDLIVITSGFLLRFGNDPNVLATTIGHELAHHYFGHTDHEHESNTYAANALAQSVQPIYELANNNALDNTNSAMSSGPDIFEEGRNQERAADLLGMYWATEAGYSAYGAYKLAQGLQELQGNWSYSPTHPSNAERMKVAQQFAQYSTHSECTAAFDFEMDVNTNMSTNTQTTIARNKQASQLVKISSDNNAEEFEIY